MIANVSNTGTAGKVGRFVICEDMVYEGGGSILHSSGSKVS